MTRRNDPFSRAERVHTDSLTHAGTSSAGIGRAEQEALHAVAAELAQLRERRLVLDAARDHGEAELVRELDRRAHDQRVARVLGHAHDERLVDLELVERQAPQIGERRIAGPVIVDGELASELVQPLEVLERMARLADDRVLGELEGQPLRCDALGSRACPSSRAGKLAVDEIARRDVDGDVHRQAAAAPLGALLDRARRAPTA